MKRRLLFDGEEQEVPSNKCRRPPPPRGASGANASIGLLGLCSNQSGSESEDADDYAAVFPELLGGRPLRPGGATGAGSCQSDLDELVDVVDAPDAVDTGILLDIFDELFEGFVGTPLEKAEDALLAPMTPEELEEWL